MSSRDHSPSHASSRSRPGEAGSAYLVAILALVVLTIAGLSLALITQTETQIGANEKMVERAFYAADSGIAISIARALVNNDKAARLYRLEDPEGPGFRLEHLVDASAFHPISYGPCNLCDIANQGQNGAQNYWRVNHSIDSTAVRRIPGTDVPIAERALTAMVELQPVHFIPDDSRALLNPETLPSY